MLESSQRISQFMTKQPHTIGDDQTVELATDIMRRHGVRHLPVLHGGKLVGILSERDTQLAESLLDFHANGMRVDEVMTNETYSVSPDAKLEEVAATMAEHKYGSAVVVEHERVVGIFTVVDACNVLNSMLTPTDQRTSRP